MGQLLLSGVPGPELDRESAAVFRRVQPGGYILFGRNIKSPGQLRKLIDDLRDLSASGGAEPIITIDQEGGRVSRLREIGSEPPNAQQLRDRGDAGLIERHGRITGRLLRLFGFNLDLCPVLDISFDDEADNSLRGRCYGKSVGQVIDFAGAFNAGLRAEGIASCGKHFPGYTSAKIDAHHELPEIDRTRAELDAAELAVFKHFVQRRELAAESEAALQQGSQRLPQRRDWVDSMMICHAFYPALEPGRLPASLSRAVITGLLRDEFGYGGLVMTDDLDMGAILNHHGLEETIRLAITAGNDLAMICHRVGVVEEAWKLLERLPTAETSGPAHVAELDRALANVHRFKQTLTPPDPFSLEEFHRRDAEVWSLRVETLGEERARERSPENGKRSPVETY